MILQTENHEHHEDNDQDHAHTHGIVDPATASGPDYHHFAEHSHEDLSLHSH